LRAATGKRQFLARDSIAYIYMPRALYAIARPSVSPSVSQTDRSYKNGWR